MPTIRRLLWLSFVFVAISACVLVVFLTLSGGNVSNGALLLLKEDNIDSPSPSASKQPLINPADEPVVRLDNYLRLYKFQQRETLSQFLPHKTCDLLVMNRITSMCRDIDRYGVIDGKWICGLHTSQAGTVHVVGETAGSDLEAALLAQDPTAGIIKHSSFTDDVADMIAMYHANLLVIRVSASAEVKALHKYIASRQLSNHPPIDQVSECKYKITITNLPTKRSMRTHAYD